MERIPLRNKAGAIRAFAVVDDDDFAWLDRWRWHLDQDGYPARNSQAGEHPKRLILRMHREILGLQPGDRRQGDHKDRNPLNNQRSNLRIVPGRAANAQNVATFRQRQGHRGVSFHHGAGKWQARVMLNYRSHYLGLFDSEDEAAAAAAEFRRLHLPYSTT